MCCRFDFDKLKSRMVIRGVAIGERVGRNAPLLLKFMYDTPTPGSGNFVFFEQSNRKKDVNFKIWRATTPYTPPALDP
jgi:hypothetical protein